MVTVAEHSGRRMAAKLPERPDRASGEICSFPPVLGEDPRILILGSMPGERSLQQHEYYAHTANAFWRLLGEILLFDAAAPYAERIEALRRNRVALWDVIARCQRQGSADSAIDAASIRVNDLRGLLQGNPGIRTIFFNGRKAEQEFRRRLWLQRESWMEGVALVALPSSSPAYAAMNFAQKLAKWRMIRTALSPSKGS